MSTQFNAARWQDYPARRVGQAPMRRIIQATVGIDHPDYQDIEARRRARHGDPESSAWNSQDAAHVISR